MDWRIEGKSKYICRKKDMKKESEDLTMRDDDGIIIHDPTDDDLGDYRDNSDVFTQEYMLEFARRHDAEIARNRRIDRLVSVSVILSIILFTALLVWIKFLTR